MTVIDAGKRLNWRVLAILVFVAAPATVLGQIGPRMMAVHEDGRMVALRENASVWTGSRIHLMSDQGQGKWRSRASIKDKGYEVFTFIGDFLLVGETLHDLEGVAIAKSEVMAFMTGMYEFSVHGDRIAVSTSASDPSIEVYRATARGLERTESIPVHEKLPAAHAWRLAFSGERVALLLFPFGDQCAVLVSDKIGQNWQSRPLIFPKICARDEQPLGGDVALEGDRLLVGAHPNVGAGAGQLAIFDWIEGKWTETVSLSRPDQEGDYVSDTVLPYGWGARVALQNGRLFTSGGYQTDVERSAAGVSASAVMNGFFIVERQPERWQTIKNVTYNQLLVPFGEFFELAPGRLFVDSPLESGVFVWDETSEGWEHAGIIYPPEAEESTSP